MRFTPVFALPGFARLGLELCAWLALAAGCGRTEAPAQSETRLQAETSRSLSFTRGDPRLVVAHAGIRRLEFPKVAGPGRSFRERIATDGHGRYSIQPVDAREASSAEWEGFELLQRGREGFHFRYRDFFVRDARLFARNWRTTDLGRIVVVAGRSCALHRVERAEGEPSVIELSIDVDSGLVLASQEFAADGQLVAAMTYESVWFDPDLGAVAWHVPANEELVLAPGADDLTGKTGEPTLRPRQLPRGYGPLEAATVGDGRGKKWLKLTYSDGVEPLFFFQALGERAHGVTARSEARLDGAPRASSVVVFEVGAATAIQGSVDGFELMVIGKAPQAELLDLIESSLP